MRLLLFSDIHCDLSAARAVVEMSGGADVVVGAGDLAVMRRGLEEVTEVLSEIKVPTVLVPGNGESDTELAAACSGWPDTHVLHGSGVVIDDVDFWGLGAAVPVTPFGDWSFDATEEEAEVLLLGCPTGAVLVSHSPPLGYVDTAGGRHLGSRAVLEAIQRTFPLLVVCGHIHACWRQESSVGSTRVVNAGPAGIVVEV